MNFKSILLAAAVGLTTLGVVPEAKAADCMTQPGYRICYEMVGLTGSYQTWDLTLTNRFWTEHMQVVCDGKVMHNWASRGGASQQEAHRVAEVFCAI